MEAAVVCWGSLASSEVSFVADVDWEVVCEFLGSGWDVVNGVVDVDGDDVATSTTSWGFGGFLIRLTTGGGLDIFDDMRRLSIVDIWEWNKIR